MQVKVKKCQNENKSKDLFFLEKLLDRYRILVYYLINTVGWKHGGGQMKFNNNLPIYIQIMDYVKRQIITQELKEGNKLPSVRALSTKLKVNPNTIQRSYQELERENLVFTQRGTGTFVTEDKDILKELKDNIAEGLVKTFIEDMNSLGISKKAIIDLINQEIKE